jgi:hypothetical protein
MFSMAAGVLLAAAAVPMTANAGNGLTVTVPPVPVTVQNSPTVEAKQLGTWSFDILGTPVFKLSPDANTVKIDPNANLVQAQQSGAWSVGISGTPTVHVQSSPENPVYVSSTAGTPGGAGSTFTFDNQGPGGTLQFPPPGSLGNTLQIQVLPHSVMTIESVSAEGFLRETGRTIAVGIPGGSLYALPIAPGSNVYSAYELRHTYVMNPGDTPLSVPVGAQEFETAPTSNPTWVVGQVRVQVSYTIAPLNN